MSSLAKYFASDLCGFFSYSREDDEGFDDALSSFRDAVQKELGAQLGRNRTNFRIWQDKIAIPHGALWHNQITEGIKRSSFFIPIITPRVVNSSHCAFEFEAFLAREAELGRDDLIFPVLYIPVPELEDDTWQQNRVLSIVHDRQYLDWRDFRPRNLDEREVRTELIKFCRNISNALRKPWEIPATLLPAKDRDLGPKIGGPEATIETARQGSAERVDQKATVAQSEGAELSKLADAASAALPQSAERDLPATPRPADTSGPAAFFGVMSAGVQTPPETQNPDAAIADPANASRRPVADDKPPPRPAWYARKPVLIAAAAACLIVVAGAAAIFSMASKPNDTRLATTRNGPEATTFSDPAPKAKPIPQAQEPVREPHPQVWTATPPSQPAPAPQPQSVPSAVPCSAPSTAAVPPQLSSVPSQQSSETTIPAGSPQLSSICTLKGPQSAINVGGPLDQVTPKLAVTPKELRSIAISPDAKRIVTAGDDAIVRVWDAATFKWVAELPGHTKRVYSVAFSDDGAWLASTGWDGTVRIWDAQTLQFDQAFRATTDAAPVMQWGVAFQPGSRPNYVYSAGDDGAVWVWNLSTGRVETKKPSGDAAARSLSFSPSSNSEFVTAGFDGKIRFFAGSGRIDPVTAGTGKVLGVAYSPDGRQVASAGVDAANKGVKVWNVASHKLFRAYEGHVGYAVSVAWSHDGGHLASSGGDPDRKVRLWDVQSGAQLKAFSGHDADVEAVAFHPNQKWLISASEDGTMKVWDISSGKELLTVAGIAGGQYIAYAPSGCYTGSANASHYMKFVTKNAKGVEQDVTGAAAAMFVPGGATALLLPQ